MARALRRAQLEERGAQAPPRTALSDEPRVPAGLHLRSEREQRLLRTRAVRPLQAPVREALAPPRVRVTAEPPPLVLDELHRLPVADEVSLSLGRRSEEAPTDGQLSLIPPSSLLGVPRIVDPLADDQSDRGLDLPPGAVREPLEPARADLDHH